MAEGLAGQTREGRDPVQQKPEEIGEGLASLHHRAVGIAPPTERGDAPVSKVTQMFVGLELQVIEPARERAFLLGGDQVGLIPKSRGQGLGKDRWQIKQAGLKAHREDCRPRLLANATARSE